MQSDVGESYQQVRLYLDQGRQVLFSGTPCQVDGLYRYLGEHPERLITCDVACSGVCSPGIWEKLVRSMAYVKQQRPLTVDFCGKLSGDSVRRFHVSFETAVSTTRRCCAQSWGAASPAACSCARPATPAATPAPTAPAT